MDRRAIALNHSLPITAWLSVLCALQYYTYTANVTGTLSVKACSRSFAATTTVMVTGATAGAAMVALDCGTCAHPPV